MSSIQSQDEGGNQGVEENDAEEEAGCHVAEKIVCGGASWGNRWGGGRPLGQSGSQPGAPAKPRCAVEALLFSLPLGPRAQERPRRMENPGNIC